MSENRTGGLRALVNGLEAAVWHYEYRRKGGSANKKARAFAKKMQSMGYDLGDSIQNAFLGFGTSDDPGSFTRVNLSRLTRLKDYEIDWLVAQSKLARRVVEDVVEDAFSKPMRGMGAYKVVDTRTGEAIHDPLAISDKLETACMDGRRRGRAALLLVTDADEDTWGTPLAPGEEIVNVINIEDDEMTVARYSDDMRSDGFGTPEVYQLTPERPTVSFAGLEVHKSRLLITQGVKLPIRLLNERDFRFDSVLQGPWDSIRKFLTVEEAMVSIVQRFQVAVFGLSGLQKILSSADGENYLQKRMALLQKTISNTNAAIIDKDLGEEYTRQYAAVNGLDTIWDRLAHSVARDAQEPVSKLFGMAPSGLATDDASGRAQWRLLVNKYRTNRINPLLRQYFAHISGIPIEFLAVIWEPLNEQTQEEAANVRNKDAQTRQIYTAMGVDPTGFEEQLREERIVTGEGAVFLPTTEEPPPGDEEEPDLESGEEEQDDDGNDEDMQE